MAISFTEELRAAAGDQWERIILKIDSGATDHFMPTHFQGTNHRSVLDGVQVRCANNTLMLSRAVDRLPLPNLPATTLACHKFDEISTPLISVGKICDGGCYMLFDEKRVIIFSKTLKALAIGYRNPLSKLYEIPLKSAPLMRNPIEPVPRVPASSPRVNTTIQQLACGAYTVQFDIALGAYEMKTVPMIVKFVHATLGFPVISTLIKAIEQNFLVTWPGMTKERVLQYLDKSEHTPKGHMRLVLSNY